VGKYQFLTSHEAFKVGSLEFFSLRYLKRHFDWYPIVHHDCLSYILRANLHHGSKRQTMDDGIFSWSYMMVQLGLEGGWKDLNTSVWGDFWTKSVKILVFLSPTGYHCHLPVYLHQFEVDLMDSSKEIGNFPEIYNFNWLFLKLTHFIITSD